MDEQIQQFIDNKVGECLQDPQFANLPEDQKNNLKERIYTYLYKSMILALIEQLNDAQVMAIKDLELESPEMEEKLQQFSAEIPGMAFVLEDKLNEEALKIKQTGSVPE